MCSSDLGGVWGFCPKPGMVSHWPAGLALAFPAAGSVQGTLVMAPGDVNLTFKRYLRDTITLQIENDSVVAIEGQGVDADMMRGYFEAWRDRDAYAVSHVGWGMNPAARWDAMTFYDRRDFNGTELRAYAGNFLYSTGANEVAGRGRRSRGRLFGVAAPLDRYREFAHAGILSWEGKTTARGRSWGRSGGRYWVRTSDPSRVKRVLYH